MAANFKACADAVLRGVSEPSIGLPALHALLTLLSKREGPVATLTIRNVEPEVQKRLRVRAAHNGRSMEAEVRQILKEAVEAAVGRKDQDESGLSLAEAIRRRFARYGGVELETHPPTPVRPPPKFR